MESFAAKSIKWKRLLRRLTVAGTGSIVLCSGGCLSAKKSEQSERMVRTERIEQEVILLPESERLIVDPVWLSKMPVSEGNPGGDGLSVRKREDGLIEIAHRRDTVRVNGLRDLKSESADIYRDTKRYSNSFPSGLLIILLVLILVLIRKK